MNYHVFIVDKNTFQYHLEYMFAGTGAGDKCVPFISDHNATIHATIERNLVGMIADISRIRVGDKIVFYLQASDGNSGMFYGIFKAYSTAFFDENDEDNYLKDKILKPLTFRIEIAPDRVYPVGVSEHDYLDSLEGINYPFQMCWSLIYRKLKGNRGCTMITEYEFERLVTKLEAVNTNLLFGQNVGNYTFDDKKYVIKENEDSNEYKGRRDCLSIKDRMLLKASRNNAFEVHLQAYLMQNYDKEPLKNLILPCCDKPYWIGNEVSCGVGMQRIDTMIIQEKGNDVFIKIIELKCIEPYVDILVKQLPWYISWVSEYVAPNYISNGKTVHIIPCVLAKSSANNEFIIKCRTFHQGYANACVFVDKAEYIGFDINKSYITFKKII